MSCAKPVTLEPLLGGLDARNHRGTGRPQDFELILNMDGSIEEGYQRITGWRKYGWDAECFVNQDLHDQMPVSQSVVDITPTIIYLAPVPPASPWMTCTISMSTNRYSLRNGRLYIRVTYLTSYAAGLQHAEGALESITTPGIYTVNIDLPGDVHDVRIIRAIGDVTGDLVQLELEADAGTGVIVEDGEDVCGPFATTERSEISLLRSVTTTAKKRMLFAATREAIFVGDDLAGNWRVIADGLGDDCGTADHDTSMSFKMVTMGDIALFTNGFDPIIGYRFNDGPAGVRQWSADYVADLQALRITAASVIGKFAGFVLIGDVVADAQTQPSRVYWSDYNDPMGWIPGGQSAAGFHDFGHGEIVLAIEPIGGVIRVYTSQAIYDGRLVSTDEIFSFEEIHRHQDSAELLRYPNTLVNTGDTHYYLGADSVFATTVWDRAPRRVEWMHVSSGVIFRGVLPVVADGIPDFSAFVPINKLRCKLPVGGYDTVREAVWFSWPTTGDGPNDKSLVLWPRYNKGSVINQGFTAFANHRPDHMITLRDWFDQLEICHAEDSLLAKEGAPCLSDRDFEIPAYLYNASKSTSDPMDPESAIAKMCSYCLNDLCNECDADSRFLMAATGVDVSIKEYAAACGIREVMTGRKLQPFPIASEGCYEDAGFTSVLQQRINRYGTTKDKLITFQEFNASTPGGQTLPVVLKAQVGVSDCADTTRWSAVEEINACDSDPYPIPDEHTLGSRPTDSTKMPFYECGEYVTCRLFVEGLEQCFKVSGWTIMIGPMGE